MPSGTRFTTSHRFCKILRWRWETFHYFVQLAANWIAVTSRLKQLHGRGSQLLAALLSKVFCDVSGLPPPTLQGLVYPSGMFMVKIWIAFWKIPFQILPTALSWSLLTSVATLLLRCLLCDLTRALWLSGTGSVIHNLLPYWCLAFVLRSVFPLAEGDFLLCVLRLAIHLNTLKLNRRLKQPRKIEMLYGLHE